MRESSKTTLKNVFGSLINNQRSIDGAKNNPWWIAIIMFILGIFLPVIPMMVQAGKTYGSSFLDGTTYGYEVTMTKATQDLKAQGFEFTVDGKGELIAYKNEAGYEVQYLVDGEGQSTGIEKPVYEYINSTNNQISLQVYWSPRTNIQPLYDALNAQKYQTGTSKLGLVEDDPATEDVDEAAVATYYAPSYTILYPNGIISVLKKNNTTEIATYSYLGNNWKHFENGTKVLEKALNVEMDDAKKVVTNKEYNAAVMKNWAGIYDVAYTDQKTSTFWAQTGIYTGIYAAISLFMGLMLWLLTRGKRNMFNYLKLHTCLAIDAYNSVACGILGLVLGFIFKNYSMMFFIILIGLRTMWMSMKQLRPQY